MQDEVDKMSESPRSDTSEDPDARPNKRSRRCAKACNRCKSRKQRCDGEEPCGNCVHYKARCVFEKISVKKVDSVTLSYITALEERCAQLESAILRTDPQNEEVQDHLSTAQAPDEDSSPAAPRPTVQRNASSSTAANGPAIPILASANACAVTPRRRDGEQSDDVIRHYLEDLSAKAFAETPYVGEVSGLSFAKLAKASMRHGMHVSPAPFRHCGGRQQHVDDFVADRATPLPDATRGQALFLATYMHVQARYPFLQWPLLRRWHKQREQLCAPDTLLTSSDDKTGAFFIWMTYAVGATFIGHHTAGRAVEANRYFAAAMTHLDAVLGRHDLLTVQALSLTAMYSFRAEDGPSVWHLVGLAMRICIENGFHRKTPELVREAHPLAAEVKCRVFWSVYTLDRLVSITLGRPMSIGDDEIEVEEPLDIDCGEMDPAALRKAYQKRAQPRTSITSMTSACHWIRLFRIRSSIIRRFKDPRPMEDDEVVALLNHLEAWKARLPKGDHLKDRTLPLLTHDRLMKGYNMAVTLLLRPRANRTLARDDPFLRQLAEASAHSCELENNIIASDSPAHSMAALHSTFISGLTLLQALAVQRDIVPLRRSARGIRACSSVLVAYATLFPEAQTFRVAFEDLIDGMEDSAATNAQELTTRPSQHVETAYDPSAMYQAPVMPSLLGTADGGASMWQQKVLNVEAMLQGDLQQDFASLAAVFGPTPVPETNDTLVVQDSAQSMLGQDMSGSLLEDGIFDFSAYSSLFEM